MIDGVTPLTISGSLLDFFNNPIQGAEVVLTGIQPRIAQTLVTLGISMDGVATLRSLQEGIAFALRRGPGGASSAVGLREGG